METAKTKPWFWIWSKKHFRVHTLTYSYTYIFYIYIKLFFSQVDSFVLLYNYDEIIGHLMWYVCTELCQDWFLTVLFKIYIMYMLYIYVKNVRTPVGFWPIVFSVCQVHPVLREPAVVLHRLFPGIQVWWPPQALPILVDPHCFKRRILLVYDNSIKLIILWLTHC